MKQTLRLGLIIGLFCIAVSAQKIAKPTLTPKPATDAQTVLIRQGIALHDAKKYDEAVAAYEKVLAENPDCTLAIYELAMSLYTKGDRVKAMETAHRGAKYKAPELPLFYGIMANALDDVGKPNEAIKIYRDAIKILDGDKEYTNHLSNLYFNLGVTYARQNKYAEARPELKKAVEYDYKYASPHYLLAVVYQQMKYKVPALLSSARLISLEINSQRTKQSAAIFTAHLRAPEKNEKTGNINIFMDIDAPKDEGDFGMYDLMLGMLMVTDDKEDKGKTEDQLFVEAVDTFIGMLSGDKKLTSTFVGKNYVPFMIEMKRQGHTPAFAYLVRYQSGNQDALKWLITNDAKLSAFVNWAKAY